jgi:FlaA1/EpsC-like NDP-sugar epimerase
VSTDKAVEPTSVLGATKRLAEWYVQAATSSVHRKIVRFGNVFGSQGSVVPLFEEQLADGGPVTVTHPEMERYFMTVDEACGLILQTVLFDSAPVYCLQMGEPIDIVEIARTLVRRWYPGVDPDRMIEFVGRRPGEKLSEQLVMPHEQVHPTEHESILGLRGPVPYSRTELEMYFRHLKHLAQQAGGSRASLRRALSATDLQAVSNEISSLDR